MEKRKLIWENKSEAEAFEKDVISTAEKCNYLIEVFQNFQDWQKISTLDEWLHLVSDAKAYFDKALLANVQLSTGGRKADPAALATLVGIDRDSYLNLVAGLPVADPDCVPCRKIKIRKGKTAISLLSYNQVKDYLIFNAGNFSINEETITIHKDSFRIFADTPGKMEITNFWESVCDTLNLYHEKYHINADNKMLIGKILKLQLSQGTDGKFIVNNQALSLEILNTK